MFSKRGFLFFGILLEGVGRSEYGVKILLESFVQFGAHFRNSHIDNIFHSQMALIIFSVEQKYLIWDVIHLSVSSLRILDHIVESTCDNRGHVLPWVCLDELVEFYTLWCCGLCHVYGLPESFEINFVIRVVLIKK